MTATLFWSLGALVLGLLVGSFLNVVIARLPADESVVRPRSRCPSCREALRWYHNLPVVSWLALRGRCAYCGAAIGWTYPLVELATVAIWAGCVVAFGPSWRAVQGILLLTILLAIAVIDGRHYLIPDELSLGGLGLGLGLAFAPGPPTPVGALVGAAVGGGLLWVVGLVGGRILGKDAMGGGDVKMMAMVGAFLGWWGALLTIFLGALVGTLVFGPISLRRKVLVPFGIFLAVGGAIAFAFGDRVLAWYLGAWT